MTATRNVNRRLGWRMATLLMAVLLVPSAMGASQEPVATAKGYARSWTHGVSLLRQGDVQDATRIITETIGGAVQSPEARAELDKWLAAEKKRWELTQRDYERYTKRAQKRLSNEKIAAAVEWAHTAQVYAPDPDTFPLIDWVKDLKQAAMKEGKRLREEHDWNAAHHLFYWLSQIYEDNERIEQQRDDCFEHARLEGIYGDEDERWRERLEGINSAMVEDALWRIDQKYVVNPDFRVITEAGFRELLLLAESPALRENFESLAGERGQDFVSRIRRRYQQVKNERSLTHREALHYFRRALRINQQTVDLPEALIVKEYLTAALNELDDFTSVIWPIDFREFEKHTRGDFIGVGIQIRNRYNPELEDEEILVVTPLEDTPAYRAGIQAHDVITAVNGESLLGVPVTKAVTMITGPLGTTVTLTIRRETDSGEDVLLDFKLKRDIVKIQSVKGVRRSALDEQRWDFMLDREAGIAYIRVISFQENTIDDLRAALSTAASEGMHGLILDLRNNPGGLLKSAVQVVELFLGEGERIVSTRGRKSSEWWQDAEGTGLYADIPLVVLINEGSASASEIVSGAIKDHNRGLVIGESSFGKFSVQNLIQLVRGEAHLKLTTAHYFLPSGKMLHRQKGAETWGVQPDIVVPLVPKEWAKIRFMQRDADVIGAVKTSSEDVLNEPVRPPDDEEDSEGPKPEADDAAGNDADKTADAEQEQPDENNRPRRDPQLETAQLVMRLHMLAPQSTQMAHGANVEKVEVANE